MAPTILIVEDDQSEAQLYEEEFADEGYDVRTAASSDEALEAIKDERPDVVVVDINMPGKDGLELLKDIMAIDNKLPVVLNTAYSEYQHNYTSWSAVAYVVKSSDTTELRQTVRNVLAGKA